MHSVQISTQHKEHKRMNDWVKGRHHIADVARIYADIVKEQISESDLTDMLELNDQEVQESICHSHDYLDSNQAMIDAFDRYNVEMDFTIAAQAARLAKSDRFYTAENEFRR